MRRATVASEAESRETTVRNLKRRHVHALIKYKAALAATTPVRSQVTHIKVGQPINYKGEQNWPGGCYMGGGLIFRKDSSRAGE